MIPLGIDMASFRPGSREAARGAIGWPAQTPTVLFVGATDNPIKRYTLARRAVDLAAAEVGEVELRVASDVSPGEMPLHMVAADVLLVTSSHEGGPLVVREALACALPVVSTDVGEVRERLAGIEGCAVCEDDRPETIAAELVAVLRRGGRLSVDAAVYDLDEDELTRRLIDVYKLAMADQ